MNCKKDRFLLQKNHYKHVIQNWYFLIEFLTPLGSVYEKQTRWMGKTRYPFLKADQSGIILILLHEASAEGFRVEEGVDLASFFIFINKD